MNNKVRNVIIFFCGLFVVAIIIFVWSQSSRTSQETTGLAIDNISTNTESNYNNEMPKEAILYFYDNKTNCSLDGDVYLDNNLIGKTDKGILTLSEGNFSLDSYTNYTVMIKGLTSECFGNNKNLPFMRIWDAPDFSNYFGFNETIPFETELTPRQPMYYEEVMGFIRPEEAQTELRNMNLKIEDNPLKNADNIFGHFYMSYISDNSQFNSYEYWQTPAESIRNKGGDCEDWAVRFVSLLRAFNSSTNCYIAMWDTHANVLCRFDKIFKIYDQEKTTASADIKSNPSKDYVLDQENKAEIRGLLSDYFGKYGLSANERKLYALVNDKELIEFNNTEQFVNWATGFS